MKNVKTKNKLRSLIRQRVTIVGALNALIEGMKGHCDRPNMSYYESCAHCEIRHLRGTPEIFTLQEITGIKIDLQYCNMFSTKETAAYLKVGVFDLLAFNQGIHDLILGDATILIWYFYSVDYEIHFPEFSHAISANKGTTRNEDWLCNIQDSLPVLKAEVLLLNRKNL